jgi:hypothetical protein
VHYTRDLGSVSILIALIAVAAIGALVFFGYARTPSGPSTVRSTSVTKPAPPPNTTPPALATK